MLHVSVTDFLSTPAITFLSSASFYSYKNEFRTPGPYLDAASLLTFSLLCLAPSSVRYFLLRY